MTFLDDLPQDWTRPELLELRDLFVLAYPRPSAAEQIADEAGLVPGTFPLQDNMRMTWTRLVRRMGDQAKLRTLVTKAALDPTAEAYRPRFEEMLGGYSSVAPSQSLEISVNWWKGDDCAPVVATRLYSERLMERRSRLFDIELARRVATAGRSVAKLSLQFASGRAHGTGFVVGEDLILTNHHNIFDSEHGAVLSVVAEFDYDQSYHKSALVRKAFAQPILSDSCHDWALLRLKEPVNRAPLELGTSYEVGIDDSVVIIQHPLGARKQFALEPLAIRYVDNERIQYVADTQHGSSGSPVFNVRMEVIALHHAEAETTVMVGGKPETVWRNEGIHIAEVTRGLQSSGMKFPIKTRGSRER